jgi:hypothetical protein
MIDIEHVFVVPSARAPQDHPVGREELGEHGS